ncbi:MAG: DUF4886 domain-containing protein [Clostridiales bacterium]|nr:DUF4886 domain-containing protein [Clostridiales bacterium]
MLKILCVGNSFSEDASTYLGEIAKSAGQDVLIGNLVIGGCSLETHLNNLKTDAPQYLYFLNEGNGFVLHENTVLTDALTSEQWDVITLQQASHDSGKPETYEPLPPLLTELQTLCPNAKFYWHMTWAYQGNSTHWAFPRYYANDQAKMYESILSCVQQQILPDSRFTGVIPNGTAVQNARETFGDNLTRDGFHLSLDLGRYIAALTFFTTLTGQALDKVTFLPEGVTEQQAELAKKCVENAIKAPFQITKGN